MPGNNHLAYAVEVANAARRVREFVFTTISGATYLAYDGADATMHSVLNDPNIHCPNANWDSISTNYCDGVSSDDIVAHEWSHAYTEYKAVFTA